MASEEKKHLESILKPVLKKEMFRKKGGTWWRKREGFIQVINIQGSRFSKRFYLNLGVYIRALGDKEFPAEYDCHLRVRLGALADSELENMLLDYEAKIDKTERLKIADMILSFGIPWLDKCSSFEGAKAEYTLPNRVMTAWQRKLLDGYFA